MIADFVELFEGMTPNLRAYLEYDECPSYEFTGKDRTTPTPESAQRRKRWDEGKRKAKEAIEPGLLERFWRSRLIWICEGDCEVSRELVEIGKRYQLEVSRHVLGHCVRWRLEVFVKCLGGHRIKTATTYHSYMNLRYQVVLDHGYTGHDYLLMGEGLYDLGIMQLSTGFMAHWKAPSGFIPVTYHPSPHGDYLAVSGTYWGVAGGEEIHIFDFEDPMSLPWPVLGLLDEDEVEGWSDSWTLVAGRKGDFVNFEGHRCHGKHEHSLTDEEIDEIHSLSDALDTPESEHDPWKEDWVTHQAWKVASYKDAFCFFVERLEGFRAQGWSLGDSLTIRNLNLLRQKMPPSDLSHLEKGGWLSRHAQLVQATTL